MKYVLLCCCLVLQLSVTGQVLLNYKDTINHFSIAMPDTWHYEDKNTVPIIKLTAYESYKDRRENVTVMIVDQPSSNIHVALQEFMRISMQDGKLRLMDSGNVFHDGQQFMWIDEWPPSRSNSKDTMFCTDFIGYDNNRAYVFTGNSHASDSARYRKLFHQMGQTFKIGKASKEEELKLMLSEEWKSYSDRNSLSVHMVQFMPKNESAQNWTSMITILSQINLKDSISAIFKRLYDGTKQGNPMSKISILERGTNWGVFKVEGTSVRDEHPSPASQIWYAVQGKKSFHTVFITIREATLTEEFTKKWSGILKKSKVVNE